MFLFRSVIKKTVGTQSQFEVENISLGINIYQSNYRISSENWDEKKKHHHQFSSGISRKEC
jgi:hypothetical protein